MKDKDLIELIESRLKNTPCVVDKYTCLNPDSEQPNHISSDCFVLSKQIACNCGNQFLHLKTAQLKELRGVCVKSIFTHIAPPLYTVCSKCNKTQLLFDPVIHGWNGELELVADNEQAVSLFRYKETAGQLFVQLTYQDPEKYQVLLDKGIDDIENYFDSITLFYSDSRGENIQEVFARACFS